MSADPKAGPASWTASPQQEAIFEDIRSGEGHSVVIARAGCISGDAIIGCHRAGRGFSLPLRELVAKQNGAMSGSRVWAPGVATSVRAPRGETIGLARLAAAMFSGAKTTYALKLAKKELRLTEDHLVLRADGAWVPSSLLAPGDYVLTEAPYWTSHLAIRLVPMKVVRALSTKRVEDTFDLTVPGPDAFVANGVVVHNCGKTSTIVRGLTFLPPRIQSDTLLVAFNKSIAKELQEKAPPSVTVSTLHSYGLRQISRAVHPRPQIDEDKMGPIIREIVGDRRELGDERVAVKRLVSLAKATLAKSLEDFDALIDSYGVGLPEADPGLEDETRERVISEAIQALSKSNDLQSVIDFDDMIYFPCAFKIACQKFARVFVDETQDLNEAQIKLTLKASDSSGRVFAIGDDRQAIYGFRGAAEGAVQVVIDRLEAKVLKLTVTRRCPKAVVVFASRYVPDFEAAPDAPEGEVRTVDLRGAGFAPLPGDFVLSRTNAALIACCFRLLKEGKRVSIQGRDIGARLRGVISKTHAATVEDLNKRIARWAEKEVSRLVALERDTSLVVDTAECVYALSEGAAIVEEILARIDRIFTDDGTGDRGRIVLSTTHKAKGLERDRVWLLADTFLKRDTEEERNLFYVAATRSKRELVLCREDK